MLLSAIGVAFTVLFFVSCVLCITMLLAWLHFGKRAHALTWALAYGGGMVQWISNGAGLVVWPGNPALLTLTSIMVLVTSALVAIGCRQRANLPGHYGIFAAAILLAAVIIAGAYTIFPSYALRAGVTNLFAAAMMPVAIAAVRPRNRKAHAPEIAVMVMLGICGIFELGLSVMAMMAGSVPERAFAELLRTVLLVGFPPIYTGVGIAALFLLAMDLAESVRILATRDPLTGSLNRRGLEQAAISAIASARRRGRPLSLVVGDIDRFKSINDQFGHLAGDRALSLFAAHVQACVREEDLFARIGGDEFCILLTDATVKQARITVERIRSTLQTMEVAEFPRLRVSASFGITDFTDDDVSLGDMLRRADLALYDSKLGGRNMTTIAEPLILSPERGEFSERAVH